MYVSCYLGSGLDISISPWKGGSLTTLHTWKARYGSCPAPYSLPGSRLTNYGWHTCTSWSSTTFWHLLVRMKRGSTPWWVLERKWERPSSLRMAVRWRVTSIHTSEVCPQVKIWNLEKRDGGNPLCTRIFPAIPGAEPTVVSCLTVHENLNFMAIGKQKEGKANTPWLFIDFLQSCFCSSSSLFSWDHFVLNWCAGDFKVLDGKAFSFVLWKWVSESWSSW